MSDNKTKKPCPQCEGIGQEDVGAIPVTCRKCHGSGEVAAIRREASFLNGGELEKYAQLDDLPADEDTTSEIDGARPEPAEDDERLGAGFDTMSILRADIPDQEMKSGIFSTLNGFSPEEMILAMKASCELTGVPEATAMTKAQQEKDEAYGIKRYVYMSVDTMDRQQLRDFYRTMRELSTGE